MAASGGLCRDGSKVRFQQVYQEEAYRLLIGWHTVRRVDLSSSVRRRKQRSWLYDLHDNGHGHVGIDAAFHDHDAHSAVTNRAVLESEGAPRITECEHVADYKTGVHAFSSGSPASCGSGTSTPPPPGPDFPAANFVDEAYLA